MTNTKSDRGSLPVALTLLICLAVSAACVAYPMYVIRPFRAQGAGELATALAIIRFRPIVIVACAAAAFIVVARRWRSQSGLWSRCAMAAAVVLVCLLGALASVNVTEQMFHPLGHGSFVPVRQTRLDNDEKVIAVKIGHTARAYPIRSISYHHVVNDVVEKHAIVATY